MPKHEIIFYCRFCNLLCSVNYIDNMKCNKCMKIFGDVDLYKVLSKNNKELYKILLLGI